jgi:acetylornithine deacetylase/succinyl-diaminopimelate desuccinylase-like protein
MRAGLDDPRSTGLAALLALVLAWPASGASAQARKDGLAAARSYRKAHAAAIVRGYAELLSMPNVASDSADIARNAAYIRDHLRAPGAERTVALYAHYDGQPVDSTRWAHGPWHATLYTAAMEAGGTPRPLPKDGEAVDGGWRLYARSAGDDKAPIEAILTVLTAFREAHVTPSTNVVFFFEGEEEAGSPHLAKYLDTYRDRLAGIDYWLFLDGPIHQSGRPTLDFGVRGVTGLAVTVYGAVRPLHSGHYGNWAPVPGQMLASLLASMKDEHGKVLVGRRRSRMASTRAGRSWRPRQVRASRASGGEHGLLAITERRTTSKPRKSIPPGSRL